MSDLKLIALKLDPEDHALLDACCSAEKLSKSDVMRRGLRMYAARLGVIERRTKPKLKVRR